MMLVLQGNAFIQLTDTTWHDFKTIHQVSHQSPELTPPMVMPSISATYGFLQVPVKNVKETNHASFARVGLWPAATWQASLCFTSARAAENKWDNKSNHIIILQWRYLMLFLRNEKKHQFLIYWIVSVVREHYTTLKDWTVCYVSTWQFSQYK